MKILNKKNKGITLVALVITIIILLILAGISIAQLTGNGLFENAKLAKEKYSNAQDLENSILDDYNDKINSIAGTSRDNLFSGTELLSEPVVVATSTAMTDRNTDFAVNDSIENYTFLLLTFGVSSSQTNFAALQTLTIPVDQIKYLQGLQVSNNYFLLTQTNGAGSYSCACIYPKDNITFHIGLTGSSSTGRAYFGITSIKGIK